MPNRKNTKNTKRKDSQQSTRINVRMSDDGQSIILVDGSKTLFRASPNEISILEDVLREQAFGIFDPNFSGEIEYLEILHHLDELFEKRVINTQQYNALGSKAVEIINDKLQPIRQFLTRQQGFIADVISLMPDNYVKRSNDELKHLIRTLQNSSDDRSLETLIRLKKILKYFVAYAKISPDISLLDLLEADIALINCFQKYDPQFHYSEDSYTSIRELVLNLRRFVQIYSKELYQNDTVMPMTRAQFLEYMNAYANNDATARRDISVESGIEPLVIAPGALEELFEDGIIEDVPLISASSSSNTYSSSHSELKPLRFNFPPFDETSSEDDSNPALDDYEQRKEEGEKKHFKKKKYSAHDQEKYLRSTNSSAIDTRTKNRASLSIEGFKALSLNPSATDFLSLHSAIADDSSEDESTCDEYLDISDNTSNLSDVPQSNSQDYFSENSSVEYSSYDFCSSSDDESTINEHLDNSDSTSSLPEEPQSNFQDYFSNDSSAKSPSDDFCSSSDDESRSLLSYYEHKRRGVDHREKKEHYKNPKYAHTSSAPKPRW